MLPTAHPRCPFLLPLVPKERTIQLETVEDRYERKSIIITLQGPHTNWHGVVGDQTVADAILDRATPHTIEQTSESPKPRKAEKTIEVK